MLQPATQTIRSLKNLLILLKQAHKIKCFQVFQKKKKHKSRHIYSAAREVSPEILNSYKKIKSPNKSLHYSSYLTDCYKHIC